MECFGNEGSLEEFYLVLLDGRLEYSVSAVGDFMLLAWHN